MRAISLIFRRTAGACLVLGLLAATGLASSVAAPGSEAIAAKVSGSQARGEPERVEATGKAQLCGLLPGQIAAAAAGQTLPVIIGCRLGREPDVAAFLHGRARRHLRLDHSIAARLTGAEILHLASSSAVERIEPDPICRATRDTAEASFGTTKASLDFGLSGDGDGDPSQFSAQDHTIAVIDTGIDGGHQDFAGGKIIAWHDFVNGLPAPYDDSGHGTHCASIAAGRVNPAGVGGVAPSAALVGLKVLDADGSGDSSTIAQAIEWCIDNKASCGIQVINLSLTTDGSSDGTDALSRTVNRAVAAGIVVCVAAGNAGPDPDTVGSPSAAADAITVGDMIDTGKGGFLLEPTSSRGPTADGRVKPDLCAPGYDILAAEANSGNGYIRMTGTSMAAPFVAGVAALMLQADPGLSPAQVKAMMKQTAVHFGPAGENNDYGAGRLDGYAALALAAGKSGSGPAEPRHVYLDGQFRGGTDTQSWDLIVTDTRFPLAAALIDESDGAGMDLTLYDPHGNLVAATDNGDREELFSIEPVSPGDYTLFVHSALRTGEYSLDISLGGKLPDPPAAPVNLTATTVSSSRIDLAWADPIGDETGFALYRRSRGPSGWSDFAPLAILTSRMTRYTDQGLQTNTAYSYRVQATNSGGASGWSNEAGATTLPNPPATPTGLAASASRFQVDLSWTQRGTDATGFEIQRRSGLRSFVTIGTSGPTMTRFSDPGLISGTAYTYRVRALDGPVSSNWSISVTGLTLPDPPAAPRSLATRVTGSRQLMLVWQNKSQNVTGFNVWRKSGSGDFAQIATVPASVTWFTDQGLAAARAYTYRVAAFNSGGVSGWSNEASGTTLPDPPAAPGGLAARATAARQLDLTWQDKSDNETGFEIWRQSRGPHGWGSFMWIARVGPNTTHYSDRFLTGNTAYTYHIRALNDGGASAWSNDASASTGG